MAQKKLKVIIDYDGTLTCEEDQVDQLIEKAIEVLAKEILGIPRARVKRDYWATRKKIMTAPQKYLWKVNGLPAAYGCEGAFTLNTTTIQEMLSGNEFYQERIESAFGGREYDPAAECTNYLFHKNTPLIDPSFRKGAKETLVKLIDHPLIQPIVLTNSKTAKVKRNLETIGITEKGNNQGKFEYPVDILGDTRQYHMDPDWDHYFDHPQQGRIQVLPVDGEYQVDLRRPVYYQALLDQASDGAKMVTVGDIFSLVGSVPIMMGYHFILTKTPYVPSWSESYVKSHPLGRVIEDIGDLPGELEAILNYG
jgi:hypothetical protein